MQLIRLIRSPRILMFNDKTKNILKELEIQQKEFINIADVIFKDAIYSNCNFKGINFAESRFVDVRFDDCIFDKCDLNNTKFSNCYIKTVKFSECKLIGIDWSGFNYSAFFSEINFNECLLSYGCFISLKIKKIIMKNCICKEADFEGADLQKGDFFGTDFLGSRFVNTNLQEASFINAKNYTIDPSVNKIKKAVFSLPEVYNLLNCLDIIVKPRTEN